MKQIEIVVITTCLCVFIIILGIACINYATKRFNEKRQKAFRDMKKNDLTA